MLSNPSRQMKHWGKNLLINFSSNVFYAWNHRTLIFKEMHFKHLVKEWFPSFKLSPSASCVHQHKKCEPVFNVYFLWYKIVQNIFPIPAMDGQDIQPFFHIWYPVEYQIQDRPYIQYTTRYLISTCP